MSVWRPESRPRLNSKPLGASAELRIVDVQAILAFLGTWILFSIPIGAVARLPSGLQAFRSRIYFLLLAWSAFAALVNGPIWEPTGDPETWGVEGAGVMLATWGVFLLPIWLLNRLRQVPERFRFWIYLVLLASTVGLASCIPTWDCHRGGRPASARHCHPLWNTLHMH